MPAHLALHIEHMLYSRAMMTVKKKVVNPNFYFCWPRAAKQGWPAWLVRPKPAGRPVEALLLCQLLLELQ